jgi:hypothetical protein
MRSSTVAARVSQSRSRVTIALGEPVGRPLPESCTGPGADLHLNQPLGGEGDHVAQDVGVGGLLHKRAKVHHLVGHWGFLGCVEIKQPNPTGESPMAAASRSPATALSGARFASGLLSRSYTINWDTTEGRPSGHAVCHKLESLACFSLPDFPAVHGCC